MCVYIYIYVYNASEAPGYGVKSLYWGGGRRHSSPRQLQEASRESTGRQRREAPQLAANDASPCSRAQPFGTAFVVIAFAEPPSRAGGGGRRAS